MHFELLLTGRIPNGKGNKNPELRTDLRLQVHRQMEQVWRSHPLAERPELLADATAAGANIRKHGRLFKAVVREGMNTACRLRVVFYEPVGGLEVASSVADPDNRVAGLLDILAVPTNEEAARHLPDPVHSLMEDDKLVWALSVERRRLLREIELSSTFTRVAVQVFPTAPTTDNPALVDVPVH